MLLYIDRAGMTLLRPTTQIDGRWYYSAKPPTMAILRADGYDLPSYAGLIVDAQVGWDEGTPGFVREANEGRRHTKITIRRAAPRQSALQIVDSIPPLTRKADRDRLALRLSAVLAAAPTEAAR